MGIRPKPWTKQTASPLRAGDLHWGHTGLVFQSGRDALMKSNDWVAYK